MTDERLNERRDFLVDLRSRWDEDDRLTVKVSGIGPHEARRVAEDLYPDYVAVNAEHA